MSKVERLLEEREMDGVGERLEAHWLGETEQYSLRELADWFNKQLLERAHEANNESYFDGEIENKYRLLTGDVSSGETAEVEARLEQAGIDVADLRKSFVSHQSIYNYLTKVRGVSREDETTDESRIEKTDATIQRLGNRTNAVVTKSLESLRNTDRISLDEFSGSST